MYNNIGLSIQLAITIILFGGFVTKKEDINAFQNFLNSIIKKMDRLVAILSLIGSALLKINSEKAFRKRNLLINMVISGIIGLSIGITYQIDIYTIEGISIIFICGFLGMYIFLIILLIFLVIFIQLIKVTEFLFEQWIRLSSLILSQLIYKFILLLLLILSFVTQFKF